MKARVQPNRTEALAEVMRGKRRLLVLTHTNPDPDSMGSAMGLRYLAREAWDVPSDFGLVGRVMRAENKAMVACLGIDLTPIGELDLDCFDCIALVDSQPGFGHTSVPDGRQVDIVLDHHVSPDASRANDARFVDVRPDVGATSSIVTGYIMELGMEVPSAVATGLFYGIRTDTADLSRDTSELDERAYQFLMARLDRQKLARITTPALPLAYYRALRDALTNMRMYDKVVLCSIGRVSSPEMVAEVADLLVRLEGKQAVFCGGMVERTYHVSVRDELRERDAWQLIHDAFDGEGSYGGHGSIAGGSIKLPDGDQRTIKRLERRLERNILRSMGVEGTTVVGLVES